MFVVEGGLIYPDKPANGGVAAGEDGFTLLELTRKYYGEAGLDVRQLGLFIRWSRVAVFVSRCAFGGVVL